MGDASRQVKADSSADISLNGLLTEGLLEGTTSEYFLYVGESKVHGAGLGLFADEDIPAGEEVLRASTPLVAVV